MDKIHEVLNKVNARPEVRQRYAGAGFELVSQQRSRAQLEADLKAEFDRNAGIVKTYGIKLN